MFVLQRGQYGEVCVFASILCKYDLRKGYSFVLCLWSVYSIGGGGV